MILFKSHLSKKEKTKINSLLYEITDLYADFYITKNNLRLFVKDNVNILFDDLKKGDKIAFDNKGIAIVTGFADKVNRKYIKILCEDSAHAINYIKVIDWNLKCDLYIKIKKNNPLKDELLKQGFRFKGGRGKEILLVRYNKKFKVRKGESNDSRNDKN